MISYIKGRVTNVSENSIIIENNGIGYFLTMPSSSLYNYSIGDEDARVFTYMSVKEDGISLFGFYSEEECEFFRLLIKVSGVGPKGAVSILSALSVDELKMAITAGDSRLIATSKGIGSKTAQKIIVELKGQVEDDIFKKDAKKGAGGAGAGQSSAASEALDILEALGFTRTEGTRALRQVVLTKDMTAAQLAGEALKHID